jgi:hypothetical protein
MEGLLLLGVLSVVALVFLGLFWAVASLICSALFLPFKLLGLVFKGFALLLTLPFLLLAAILAAAVFGVGVFAFLLPALPFVLLVLAIVWLARRGRSSAVSAAR